MKNIVQKFTGLLKAASEHSEKGKTLISLLYKQAEEQKAQIQQLQEQNQQLNKSASEAADKGLTDELVRPALNKMADEGMLSSEMVEMHVEAATKDPSHMVEILKIATDSLAEARSTVKPAGYFRNDLSGAGSDLNPSDAHYREQKMKSEVNKLAQELDLMVQSASYES